MRDEDIDVSKGTVKVTCVERVSVPERTTSRPNDDGPRRASGGDVTASLPDRDGLASAAVRLEAGSSHTFETEVSIPENLPPPVAGRNARFEWQASASLDTKGNDPDSGWQTSRVW
ncbi:hypothetical protein [Rubrivirga sp.]|uniref:hypothetical protein n=1 Tax=Rubrivirga sp. TaxID=1885344 RepID=UPI003C765B3D